MAKITEILTRLGLWQGKPEPVASPDQEHPAPPTRVIRLETLMQERQGEQESLESMLAPGAWDVTDDQVFRHLAPQELPEGWTSESLVAMLQAENLCLDSDAARAWVLLRIVEAGVSAKALLADAQRRDEALDATERTVKERLEHMEHKASRRREWLESETRRLQEERARLDEAVLAAHRQVDAWTLSKKKREDDLVRLVELLAKAADAENATSVAATPPPPP